MPTVAVYFSGRDYHDDPFDKHDYRKAYADLGEMNVDSEADFWIVRHRETYLGQGDFAGGWRFSWGQFKREERTVHAHVVLDKKEDDHDPIVWDADTRVINDPALHALTMKDATYATFPDVSPRSIPVSTAEQLTEALAALPGDMAVAKPTQAAAGRGIVIAQKADIDPRSVQYPAVAQEFLDTSVGIPGIAEGVHDLRIVIVGGEVGLAYVRTPAPGSLLANVAQGGSLRLLEPGEIPEEALAIARRIDRELEQFPYRWYSVDVARSPVGWRLIELNSPAGLTSRKWGAGVDRYYRLLADLLVRAARAGH